MKVAIQYIVIAMVAILAIVLFIVYQQYMGEDTDQGAEGQTNSLLNRNFNAVVTRKSMVRNEGRKSSNSATGDSLKIDYTDINTKESASFMMNALSLQRIAVGDTVTKEKGERLLFIYKKEGGITSVAVD